MKIAEKIGRNEYYSLFPNDNNDKNNSTRYLALKEALDIRKFEIELYWKRTAFFWAFITVTYVALFNVLCKFLENPCKYYIFTPIIIILSGLGLFFSIAWHLVNKGSKFWQNNWEKHVSLLEKDTIGPLYDTFSNPATTGSKWNPIKEYDFSVSKVSMCASCLMICLSSLVFLYLLAFFTFAPIIKLKISLSSAFIVLIIVIVVIFFVIKKTNGNDNIQIKENNDEKIKMILIKL